MYSKTKYSSSFSLITSFSFTIFGWFNFRNDCKSTVECQDGRNHISRRPKTNTTSNNLRFSSIWPVWQMYYFSNVKPIIHNDSRLKSKAHEDSPDNRPNTEIATVKWDFHWIKHVQTKYRPPTRHLPWLLSDSYIHPRSRTSSSSSLLQQSHWSGYW